MNKSLTEMFSKSVQEETDKIQNLYNEFNEACKNFTANVEKNYKGKIEQLKEELQKDFEKQKTTFINNNPILCSLLMQE